MTPEQLLAEQLKQLEELLGLLQREQDALLARDVDGDELKRLAATKQRALQVLEALEQERHETHSSEAAAADRSAVEALASRCAHLNELNGSLIQRRLIHNQRFLSQLRNLAGNRLYGADGQTHREGGRVQAKA